MYGTQQQSWTSYQLLQAVCGDILWVLGLRSCFFRWPRDWRNLHRLKQSRSDHRQSPRQVPLSCQLNTKPTQAELPSTLRARWMFQTWFRSVFIGFSEGSEVLTLQDFNTLCQKTWMLLWCYFKLVVKRVMPYFYHVLPVLYYTMIDRMTEPQYTSLCLSLLPDIRLLLVHANHDWWHFGLANNCVEFRSGGFLSC